MSSLQQFQNEHGEQWNAITQNPAFSAAMSFLNLQKISEVANLTDEQIAANGALILADLRGHLKHENELFTIGTKLSLEFSDIGPAPYPDPLSEIDTPSGDNSTPAPIEQEQQPPKPTRKRKK